MTKQIKAMQAALTALKSIDAAMPFPVAKFAIHHLEEALAEALAEQPAQQKPVAWIWKYANGEEEVVFVPPRHVDATHVDAPSTITPLYTSQPAQREPDRVKFERHWRKTRGEKKANRELPRHPLQPQTYIQDSANRHWVTWQAAVMSVAPPAQRTWVGLTLERKMDMAESFFSDEWAINRAVQLLNGCENALKKENT